MSKRSNEEKEIQKRAIREIIQQGDALTQPDIVKKLEIRGIYTTQATVSRYLKEMELTKDKERGYVLTEQLTLELKEEEYREKIQQYADGELNNVRLMMLRSKVNHHAATLAATIRECGKRGVLGTVVDDDKVLILFSDTIDGEDSVRLICKYLGQDQ